VVRKSNRMSKGRGSKSAHDSEVFILTPEVEKPLAELVRHSPGELAEEGPDPRPKVTWRVWLRSHWPAVAIGGAVVTGALATWMVCRRREHRQPLDRVRRFLHAD
jgi:hypothetical protein